MKSLVVLSTIGLAILPSAARAGSGAFAVDEADVGDAGSCKVESWASAARNSDFSAVVYPTCVFFPSNPTQFGVLTNPQRSDGDWSTTVTPRFKAQLLPTAIGRFGFAAEGGLGFDAVTGQNTTAFFNVPATFRLSEVARFALNAGWFWDRAADHHYATYGVSFDYKLTKTVQFTAEVFGQAGPAEEIGVKRPRFQTGLRFRPVDDFSLDVIYGRNINGERSNWITLGTTFRFQAWQAGEKTDDGY